MTTTTPDGTSICAGGRASAQWGLWATTVRVVVDNADALADATALLRGLLDEVDVAASRFRPDSEVRRIAASPEDSHVVSPLLAAMVTVALNAAEITGGRVDPTIGTVLARLAASAPAPPVSTVRRATWRDVELEGHVLRLPVGTLLDLGATGKAFAADRAAESISAAVGCGVLVSLGGDLRVAGPAVAAWTVLVRDGDLEPASLVDLPANGAIATSSSLHRTLYGPVSPGTPIETMREPPCPAPFAHHVLDPTTSRPVEAVWRTISVAADTCTEANTWSTAAMVAGSAALDLLAETSLAACLVGTDRYVHHLGGWPT